jgi:glycosyltransferase involved in cell wall biosynthesis
MARIGINAHLLSGQAGYRQAGIHHYIRQLLNHLPDDPALDYRIFTGEAGRGRVRASLTVRTTRLPTQHPLVRIGWEQLAWPLVARQERLDLLHSMAFVTPVLNRLPTIVTVYDLSFLSHPERYTRLRRLYLATQARRSCRAATRVVTIYRAARDDIVRFFGVPAERVDVVFPAVGEQFRPLPPDEVAAFRARHGLNRPIILHVGTLQPRKNIPALIEAFAALPDKSAELVLVGGNGWLFQSIFARVQALGLQERVRFTGYVPDEQLPLWYNSADLLVFPSVYEGFGMPIVEAMACGTPVAASRVSSIPEVAGEAAHYFDPTDIAAITDALATLLHHPDQADELRERGFSQARRFSWSHSGTQMAAIYHTALRTATP